GYSTLISDINDLFNVYNYGDPSPVAIRRFADFMLDGGNPEYLFIIGKGVTPASGYYRLQDTDIINYVPTYGHPGTDVPFTSGLLNDGYESAIPTGRISAFNPEEVGAYLDKVIEMEATPFNDFWRKRSLLLSGGQTTGEQNQFRGFIEQFEDVLSGTFLGGTSSLFSKQDSKAVTFINVTDEINKGVSLVTFFGHSSATTSDIEVGLVSNPEVGYTNKGRYPVFLVNGCNAGNFYANETVNSTRIFGDDWILTPDLGAIGFVASSSFALSRNLKNFSDIFFEYGYSTEDFFGQGIGNILQVTGQTYIERFSSNQTNISQVQQFSLNGDPAVALYGADKADYEIKEEDVFFQPIEEDLIVATSDSFNISMSVKNFGRLVADPVEVTVLRTLSDGTEINYETEVYNSVNSQDTLNFLITRDPERDETGTSTFEIFIDPLNKTEELNEENNSVVLTLDIFSGSTSNLYPLDYGIVSSTSVSLVYQLSNLISADKAVEIEIDTVATFDSPWKRNNLTNSGLLSEWEVDINLPDLKNGQVFYWRTKLENPGPTENDEWVVSSFSYIPESPVGWRQTSAFQLQNSIKDGVSLSASRQWAFESESTPVRIETFGAANTTLTKDDVRVLIEGSNFLIQNIDPTPRFPDCANNTLSAVVFDRRSALPYTPIFFTGDESKQRLVCGRRPQLVYNFLEKDITGVDENDETVNTFLDSLINQSALGDVVLLFNIGEVFYSKWPARIINKLGEIGIASSTIASLVDGQPVIMVGKKGAAPGTAIILSDNGSSDPLTEQALNLVTDITGSEGEGKVQSLRIGPARGWKTFEQNITILNEEDEFSTNIYGVKDGRKALLVEGYTGAQFDLSGTDADDYPFLELEWSFSDQARQTPAQLEEWKVTFEPLPDGLLIDKNQTRIVQEGVIYQPRFGFFNYTESVFDDSLSVSYAIFNRSNRNFLSDTLRIPSPLPGDTVFFSPEFSTVD
ncbi:MAG: C25 family cysteine peptidase, partial [Cyclobacteriaceae bacterium]